MKSCFLPFLAVVTAVCMAPELIRAQEAADAETPRLPITVTEKDGQWRIEGERNRVTLDASDLAMDIEAGPATWAMIACEADDMIVKAHGERFELSLTDAGSIDFSPYDTGYSNGVKIRLSDFHSAGLLSRGKPLDLELVLTVTLEGLDEELVCTVAAVERGARIHLLDWPKPLDGSAIDHTVLSNFKGTLLPRDWPEYYSPMGGDRDRHGLIESNLIECWSMSWWGFQQGDSAMMAIVETSDDAAYQFDHPAGGPTRIGPRWRDSLGKLAYPRAVRFTFIPEGNYVTMAMRYRQYAKDTGLFVSLEEKMVREPRVAELIGAPQIRQHALRNWHPEGTRYAANPDQAYRLRTFDELADQLREIREAGVERLIGVLCGWPLLGYDRQHPDVLPPAPEAGGWDGMRRWVETSKELGFLPVLHDQYRDYYLDAPSWSLEFSVHEEDNRTPPTAFPGTRFNDWKEGYVPHMDNWDGGPMTYINARFMLGHLVKNYRMMAERDINPAGSYLDVFGYVPPTQDFNPDHPTTRRDNMNARADSYNWARNNLGIVGTESGADWTIPYIDFISGNRDPDGIPVPLYYLVYHDAVITHAGNFLSTVLGGGIVRVPGDLEDEEQMDRFRRAVALHKRVALEPMIDHEFLNEEKSRERSTFADGTTVTIDREADTFEVHPELEL